MRESVTPLPLVLPLPGPAEHLARSLVGVVQSPDVTFAKLQDRRAARHRVQAQWVSAAVETVGLRGTPERRASNLIDGGFEFHLDVRCG